MSVPRRITFRMGLIALAGLVSLAGLRCDRSGTEAGNAGEASPGNAPPVFLNPVPTANVGDWVRYELENGDEQVWEVVEVNPLTHRLMVKMEQRNPDTKKLVHSQMMPLGSNDVFLWGATAGSKIARVKFERIEEMGREYEALSVVNAGGIPGEVKSWYSREVPILGLIRRTALPKGGMGDQPGRGTERVVLRAVDIGWAKPK